jgi:hypothetical protein
VDPTYAKFMERVFTKTFGDGVDICSQNPASKLGMDRYVQFICREIPYTDSERSAF